MSIESEILRIQRNVADTYSVVADRGGNVSNSPTVARLAQAVNSIPENVLTAGDGITIEHNKINVDIPTKTLTRSEYTALSQEEKEKDILYAVLDEKEVDDRITMDDIDQAIQNAISNLDDGVPTGAVVSFMALTAPNGYLICDGTVYNISEYPELAEYIKDQFSSFNYFGGNGTTTFGVPDMRNLFLRGYHGDVEVPLSGEVGERQDGTRFSYMQTNQTSAQIAATMGSAPFEIDEEYGSTKEINIYPKGNVYVSNSVGYPFNYTSRPVNMAVLFCIKT